MDTGSLQNVTYRRFERASNGSTASLRYPMRMRDVIETEWPFSQSIHSYLLSTLLPYATGQSKNTFTLVGLNKSINLYSAESASVPLFTRRIQCCNWNRTYS